MNRFTAQNRTTRAESSGLRLAIDAGGTSTRAVIVDADGECQGRGFASGGNPVSNGRESALRALLNATADALDDAGVAGRGVVSALAAVAGLGFDAVDSGAAISAMLSEVGVVCPVREVSDAVAAFVSGSAESDGYVLIVGTGAAAQRVVGGRVLATADGLGWLLGDVGSGAWIGRRALVAAAEHLDGRGPATTVTPSVLRTLGIDPSCDAERGQEGRLVALERLLSAAYSRTPASFAQLSPFVFEGAGDGVCDAIVLEAAEGLARTLDSVMPASRHHGVVRVVGTGGVLNGQPRLRELLRDALARHGRDVDIVTVPDGLLGAVVMALRTSGVDVDDDMRSRVRRSLGDGVD